jgi:hypothetical protein
MDKTTLHQYWRIQDYLKWSSWNHDIMPSKTNIRQKYDAIKHPSIYCKGQETPVKKFEERGRLHP